jgi:four helix bundle protein
MAERYLAPESVASSTSRSASIATGRDGFALALSFRPCAGTGDRQSPRDGLLEAATKEVLMKRFEVYEMALQMVSALRPAVERIRLHDRDLALQLKRAGSSVPGNIAEGARRAGQDRLHHYRIAAGSAGEIRSHLAVAVAWGDVDQATVTPALALLDSILAILWRLTHP